jgi:hypothetical protein
VVPVVWDVPPGNPGTDGGVVESLGSLLTESSKCQGRLLENRMLIIEIQNLTRDHHHCMKASCSNTFAMFAVL